MHSTMRESNRFCILMGVMFPNFLPNNVPLELRSEVKIGVNHVRKTGKCAPEAGNSMCKSPVVGGGMACGRASESAA